jgi:predicted molibdopterin-dependent oxidoreductase YjgC
MNAKNSKFTCNHLLITLKKETPQNTPQDSHQCSIEINGQRKQAYVGQTIAAALTEANVAAFRHTSSDAPRGLFCGMGVCFECLVTINDVPEQRACMTMVKPGMKIETNAKED